MKLRTCSRREFLGMTAMGIVAVTALPRRSSAAIATASEQDLIVRNANVYTVDARLPRAEAFVIRGGRFLAVGTNQRILAGLTKEQRQHWQAMISTPPKGAQHSRLPGT